MDEGGGLGASAQCVLRPRAAVRARMAATYVWFLWEAWLWVQENRERVLCSRPSGRESSGASPGASKLGVSFAGFALVSGAAVHVDTRESVPYSTCQGSPDSSPARLQRLRQR